MTAQIISGTKVAAEIDSSTKADVEAIVRKFGLSPCLAVVIVGENAASRIYVNNKVKRCKFVGIKSREFKLPEDTDEATLVALIDQLSNASSVHGILVQLPLPDHLDARKIVAAIAPHKDVDGFHPINFGKFMAGSKDALDPCTPQGCYRLLQEVIDNFCGLDATVIGYSNIVGKPMAQLLLQAGCSVTIVHDMSRNVPGKCKNSDIIVAAAGSPLLVKSEWVKPGAVVIDVGINRLKDIGKKPYLVGDVDFDNVRHVASAITPVPGGVGPMTISYLLVNTVKAYNLQVSLKEN